MNFYDTNCIATRIGPAGDHHRVIHKHKSCDSIAAANSSADIAAARQRMDRENAMLEDFVGRGWARRVHRSCGTRIDAGCRKTLWRAYRSLPPDKQHRAAKLMAAEAEEHRP